MYCVARIATNNDVACVSLIGNCLVELNCAAVVLQLESIRIVRQPRSVLYFGGNCGGRSAGVHVISDKGAPVCARI
jgi:hypothetical protein